MFSLKISLWFKIIEISTDEISESTGKYPENPADIVEDLNVFYTKIDQQYQGLPPENPKRKSLEIALEEIDKIRSLEDPLKIHVRLIVFQGRLARIECEEDAKPERLLLQKS